MTVSGVEPEYWSIKWLPLQQLLIAVRDFPNSYMRRKAAAHNFAPHMFIDDDLPPGDGVHVCQKQDVKQLYRVCRSCHYQAQRDLAALPDIE